MQDAVLEHNAVYYRIRWVNRAKMSLVQIFGHCSARFTLFVFNMIVNIEHLAFRSVIWSIHRMMSFPPKVENHQLLSKVIRSIKLPIELRPVYAFLSFPSLFHKSAFFFHLQINSFYNSHPMACRACQSRTCCTCDWHCTCYDFSFDAFAHFGKNASDQLYWMAIVWSVPLTGVFCARASSLRQRPNQ